jgi:hypothetical protein
MEIVLLFFYCFADAMLQLVTETKVCESKMGLVIYYFVYLNCKQLLVNSNGL